MRTGKPSPAWATKRWRSIRRGSGSLGREWAPRSNGIRQGYNTDRVVELLRAGGVEYALVDRGSADILPAVPSSLSDLRSARPITY